MMSFSEQQTDALAAGEEQWGGLMDDNSSDGGDNDNAVVEGVERMNFSDNEEAAAEETVEVVFPIPSHASLIYGEDCKQFRFNMSHVALSKTFRSFPPNVLEAMMSEPKQVTADKEYIYWTIALPTIVHLSPMLSMFLNRPVTRIHEAQLPCTQTMTDAYGSSIRSLCALKCLRRAALLPTVPFHPSVTPARIQALNDAFRRYESRLEREMEDVLDQLYHQKDAGTHDAVERFVGIMESATYKAIHLHEWFVYTLLVEPHFDPAYVPFAALMTPLPTPNTPHVSMCTDANGALQSLHNFFHFRQTMRESGEQDLRTACVPTEQWADAPLARHNTLDYGSVLQQQQQQQPAFRGIIPWHLLLQLYYFLDHKAVCGVVP